ncbi:MAG: ComF family protein [Chthoniobacterales bacterium]|nr:ComF family protein [Chthoniobacterales bacterium]
MFPVTPSRALLDSLGSLLYPRHCAVCDAPVAAGRRLCAPCRRSRTRLEGPRCAICSQPFGGALEPGFRCMNCGDRELHFDFATSAYRSRGVVRELIHRFKYNKQLHSRHLLGRMLGEGFRDARVRALGIHGIVPVPLHPAREREREFNQAAVLASVAAARLRLPVIDCLMRVRYTVTQTHFHREERFENLEDAFALRRGADLRSMNLALVDDVLTTGSTADACARVLKEAGASAVVVITVARG